MVSGIENEFSIEATHQKSCPLLQENKRFARNPIEHPSGGKVAKAATSRHTVTETPKRWSFQKNFSSNFGQNGNTHSIKRCQYLRKAAATYRGMGLIRALFSTNPISSISHSENP